MDWKEDGDGSCNRVPVGDRWVTIGSGRIAEHGAGMVTADGWIENKSTPNKQCGVIWVVITMTADFLDAWTAITRRKMRPSPTNTVMPCICWLSEVHRRRASFESEQTNLERRRRCIKRISVIISAQMP